MSRANNLTQNQCFLALDFGYILENEHGYRVWLHRGEQEITNKNRYKRRGKNKYRYKFDYPTWRIVGKLPIYNRIENKVSKIWRNLWN